MRPDEAERLRQKRLGEAAEKIARAYYQQRGYFVVPTSLIHNGGAPMLEGWVTKYVLPDNLIVGPQGSRWVEVKGKDHASDNRKYGRTEHGVDLPNWTAYLEVEAKTKIPGILAIVQRDTWKLLDASFERIRQRVRLDREWRQHAPRGMAYFDIRDFERHEISTIAAELEIEWEPNPNAVRRPWELKPPPQEQGRLF